MAEQQTPQQTPAQQASQAMADAAKEAERLQLDEAGPDHYFLVNGQKVNAWGEALDSPEAKRRPR